MSIIIPSGGFMPRPPSLTDQMRDVLRACGKTQYEIAKNTGIAEATISRFMRKKRGLSPKAWDSLGKYLGLELTESHWVLTEDEKMQESLKKSTENLMSTKVKKRSKKST
jgi:plasmid maintenance system antidote protein VapI